MACVGTFANHANDCGAVADTVLYLWERLRNPQPFAGTIANNKNVKFFCHRIV